MTYTIRTANNVMPVKDYFTLLFNKLVEDYESVDELFDEYYNENEIGEMASDEKEIIVKNFAEVFYHDTIWYDGDISIVAVCDDDGNEITAEELDSNHQEYFKMIGKLEKQYYQKSVQYYIDDWELVRASINSPSGSERPSYLRGGRKFPKKWKVWNYEILLYG